MLRREEVYEDQLELKPKSELQYINPNSEDRHLSLNALKQRLKVGIIRFKTYTNQSPIVVLIYGSSFDNFLLPRIVK